MSDLFLTLALAATFGTVVLASVALSLKNAERARSVEVLRSQVSEVAVTLREQQLSGSLSERVLRPAVSALAGAARRITPAQTRQSIEARLAAAGQPAFWDPEKIVACKAIGAVVGFLLSIGFSSSIAVTGGIRLLVVSFMTFVGFYAPTLILNHKGDARQEEIRRSLPDTMDLLTISVEAGLGFDAALVQVINEVPGPLSQEFGRLLQEMRLGRTRAQAFRHLAERSSVEELRSFILAMVQADTFGVSISKVLRAQATELRKKRRQRAEEQAQKIPIKILFPLIFCILPTLFIFLLGPAAIRIADSIFGI